ncbi:uncharacterized protein DUF1794 [Sediminihabitans luteus]|uniref:Ferric nitrobindin-like protein n=1 Tax=Sediminihabitans luteus TaxID=1138585 RepID=A0A2M9CEC7_9CELL|nr:FABP family protein [Sediminihabitans luteus]PJJ70296.1 uncharacterized protein DUF1794 [Sediminihabitans luteus]GII97768.1 hypothetical protein Slu03_01460 [Sediminihabitans luteus]
MAFEIPDDLSPEVYPLAWLLGSWRGQGVLDYPGIDAAPFVSDVTFDHDGGPYLRFVSTVRVLDAPVPEVGPDGAPLAPVPGADDPTAGTVWSTETGYWRVASERPEGLAEGRFPLEVLLADAAGRVSVYLGVVGNGRVDLASDLIARTGTAAEVGASKRLFGLVEGDLLWIQEIAAFGHPMQSYASARLVRQ